MCRIKSHRHPEGLRCNGLHRSAPRRSLSISQVALTDKLESHAVARSSAFVVDAEPPPEPGAPLTLSQKVLKALLAAALVVQKQWAKVQEHRARVTVARQEAAQARIQAEADERRSEALQAASDAVEAAHVALAAAESEHFMAQLLEHDVRPLEGWPAPDIAMEMQRAYASVEADDLAQAIMEFQDKHTGKTLTLRQSRDLRALEAKHLLTTRHHDRLARELEHLPTHLEAVAAVTRAEASVLASEAAVERAEDHYESI